MYHKLFNQTLSRHIAEETQLLAEEKWLIEALTKIRNQRNSLQIERLHLESMKAKLKCNLDKVEGTLDETSIPSGTNLNAAPVQISSRNSIVFEEPLDADTVCNDEELNLAVSKSLYGNKGNHEFNMEEDEEEENCDDVVIDMNMLMNGIVVEEPAEAI